MDLGRAAKLMRTASGLKQREVARRLGVTSNYLSLIENGRREPSISFLKKLARVLGVPVGLFFLWEEGGGHKSDDTIQHARDLLAQLETLYLFAKRKKVRGRQAA